MGLFNFSEKHCEHCLKRVYNKGTEDEQTIYMHHVLEAKQVIGNMILSIGTEFIENESEDVTNQDCKLRVFYRLVEKSRRHIKDCQYGSSEIVFTHETVFKYCDDYKSKY